MRKSSSESSPISFLSLPYEVVLNCLSRVPRTHDQILSLVSKSFRSIVASPDLEAERIRILKNETCLYVCLKLNNTNPNPSWFILSQTPKQKLIPLPSFPYPHPNCCTVVSSGSEIYMLGGFVTKGKRSRRAYALDCKSHQWRRLPKMRIARKDAAANVASDGRIYVYGGCSRVYNNSVNWGEIYYPTTQTWEPFPEGEEGTFNKEGVFECDLILDGIVFHDFGLLLGGKIYDNRNEDSLRLCPNICRVRIDCQDFQATVSNGELHLFCCDDSSPWGAEVGGLEGISSNYLLSVASPAKERRVTVWWKTYTKECKTEIWCAMILFEIPLMGKLLRGVVEWSENVFTFHGSESDSDSNSFLLHYEVMTLSHRRIHFI
ncbi:F-box-like domain superfamily [Arabidopsis thaliana x Arabidopsis arenosa]|uniref:F-box-like domain superfamily n=1 Tax=Arabidopsis thaliana x Arabidopsis arenosa TaxID=1240361 RepID=A0A8T2AE63_9BRAS|nr:F-box-like domain superfamily [Arabidopsis thaliana x Arabidopsis arenosa]